ncbi:MAG: SxtJ family membrane protein [Syntrophothermus sp.]
MKEIISEIKKIKSTNAELKKFGISVGFVLTLISLYLSFKGKSSYIYFTYSGIFLIMSALSAPRLLKHIQKIWMAIGIILGWFTTRIILSVLYYIILTPIGFVMRLSGKDLLEMKIQKDKRSYWNYREEKPYSRTDTERQF